MRFRVTYGKYSELTADVQQMAHGGILIRVTDAPNLAFETPVELELVLPDGTTLTTAGKVLQLLAGHGIAVSVSPQFADEARRHAGAGRDNPRGAPARHERVDRTTAAPPPRVQPEEPSNAQKIQIALHGNRDERNAILRDRNRMLHAYVLKNPGLTVDDVLAIAKNPQMGPELFKQIAERPEWLQRSQIAVAL
ncbi:MAG TPA: hypothetical protein VFV99_29905, partial [Kofleriaceae bacterium]|nr:hypothetical protein [Kofleriaceae bacterium]